jgi:signal transduction histidine kinase
MGMPNVAVGSEMTIPTAPSEALLPVGDMLDILRLISRVEPLDVLLQKIVDTIADAFNIKCVSLGAVDESTGLFCPRALHGFPEEKANAIGRHAYTLDRMRGDLKEELKIGRSCYYVRTEDQTLAYDDSIDYVLNPDLIGKTRSSPSEWHELDYIDFVMTDRLGNWIGWIEIDEPANGRVPSKATIERIHVLADLAAIAIENSKMYEEAVNAMRDSQSYLDLITHDIGNMVDPIVYYVSSIMASKNLTEREMAQCVNAIAVARSMRGLVDSVRRLSEIKASESSPRERFSLNDILRNCAVSVKHTFPDREIAVNLHCPDKNVEIIADNLIYELFMNLLNNSVKYTPRQMVEMDVGVEEEYSAYTVSIEDRGMGIPDDKKSQVFRRFSKRPEGIAGTGLGLSIVSLLVERYGGLIRIRDRVPGDYRQGVRFEISFPKIFEEAGEPEIGNRPIGTTEMLTSGSIPLDSRKT